jgi:hypothetical protein
MSESELAEWREQLAEGERRLAASAEALAEAAP